MKKWNRRELLKNSLLGLTALGAGAFGLRKSLALTPAHGEPGEFGKFLIAQGEKPGAVPPPARNPTASESMGPYYKEGAPFRGRLMPQGAPGTPMIIRGHVYGHDTRKPLEGATIDVWQADASGSYHGMDKKENYLYRARMLTTRQGLYQFETVHPGRYGFALWARPSHIHFYVRHPEYKPLVTQLYFQGDPRLGAHERAKPSLIIALKKVSWGKTYELGIFDIVLVRK
ncbi:MAG: hypothetical protein OXL41_11295 [Nitrospinae bacterium]|nr:hypothetical protein [Nitrospinota bacterium]